TAVQNHINHPQVQKLNYVDLFMRTRYAAFGCDCFGPASSLARPFQEYHSAPRHLHHQLYLRAVQQARLPKVSFFATTSSRFKLLIHERGVSPRSNWLQRPARVDQPAPAE